MGGVGRVKSRVLTLSVTSFVSDQPVPDIRDENDDRPADCRRAQYGIDLPGSLHTNKIPAILGRYPLLGFFCHLNIVPLDRDNGTSNSSNTDVVEKVNLLVAASQHGGTSVAEGSP